jgi:hypothetical protein
MNASHPTSRGTESSSIRWAQRLILAAFYVLVLGIIGWVIGLIRLSWTLQDVPSASIGISIVAIPVFLLLLGIVNYVFWGLRKGGEEDGP